THSDGTSSGTCPISFVRVYTVLDACSNAVQISQTITIQDIQAPTFTLGAIGSIPCNPTQAQINAAVTAPAVSDNCSTGLTATFADAAETGAPGCTRSIIRTWRATDACGNTGTQTQTITYSRDLTPPTFTLGTIGAIPCNPTQAQIDAAVVAPTVSDNCSTALTATFTDAAETGAPGCTRSIIRTWRATDACGNTGTQTQTITYSRDLTPPTFTLGTIGAIPCNPTQAQIDAAVVAPTVSDNCSTALTATFTDAAETGAPGCTRSIIRTWRAVDACGNTGTQTQTITYSRDLTPPTFILGTIGAIPCNPTQAQIDAAVGAPTVSDNCSTGLTATFTDAAETGAPGCTRSIIRTWRATDACGNTGTQTQTITYSRDLIPPVINCTSPQAFCETQNNVTLLLTASDNCSGTLIITYQITGATTGSGTGNNGSGVFNTGVSTITWTVTDACGNSSTCSTTVTINNQITPTFAPVAAICSGASLTPLPTTSLNGINGV